METEMEIERHNRASLWTEAIDLLGAAKHDLELVEGILDDLKRSGTGDDLSVALAALEAFMMNVERESTEEARQGKI